MYINLTPKKHKRISFNTTTMASWGFIGPPKILAPPLKFSSLPNLICCSGLPQLFWSKIFRSTPKIRGSYYHVYPHQKLTEVELSLTKTSLIHMFTDKWILFSKKEKKYKNADLEQS